MKTAVSLPNDLFFTVERIRKKQKIKRSSFITLAVKEYIKKAQEFQLLNSINEVYSNSENNDTELIERYSNHLKNNILEKEEW